MLRVEAVTKRFANGVTALQNFELEAAKGEIVSLVGTSGCGKSTLLRIVAGLERQYEGRVEVSGQKVEGPSRQIGVVFQEPRLMPWLTVWENVAFGLTGPKEERKAAARNYVKLVGLEGFERALPRQLSGGMAQRVALARALVTEPTVLLLDEPFSSLDAFTRMQLQDHLLDVWQKRRPTLLLVTHDVDEAVYVSDRVVVMRGRPGTVRSTVPVTTPRPRDRGDAELARLRAALLLELDLSEHGIEEAC